MSFNYIWNEDKKEIKSDKLRNACKEINNLKSELREIKSLLVKVLEK